MDFPRDNLIRAVFDRADTDGRTMTGYPIVFNRWTEINSWEGKFKERVAPGSLEKTLRERGDQVKVLFNHGYDPQIGDKPLGKPLVMDPRSRGLWTETPLSETSYNDDLLALMRDGAIDGMSFRFSVVQEEWHQPDKGLPERTITELKLYEFGPVTFPAYQATTVGVRSRQDFAMWQGLDDEKRAQIAALVGIATDLRTSEPEADPVTSDDEAAASQEQPVSDITARQRQKALAALASLKDLTNAVQER